VSSAVQGFRLSPQQRRVWQLARDSRAFRVQALVLLEGSIDAEVVRAALVSVVAGVEILRTTYRRSPGVRYPLQVVAPELPPFWQTVDLGGASDPEAELAALFAKALARPFDLERGPVVQATFATLGPGRSALILAIPAIAGDAAALANLLAELSRELADGPAEEPIQYVQVSEWANELLASEESRAGRDYFRDQDLAPLAALELPLEMKATGGFSPERVAVPIAAGTAERAAAFAAELGVEERAVLLAAWLALLARLGGVSDVGAGVLYDGRTHPDLGGAHGLFARTVPIRVQAGEVRTLREVTRDVAAALAETFDWLDCFAAAEDERFATGFPALFSYTGAPAPGPSAGAVRLTVERRVANVERFKLALEADRGPSGLVCTLAYDTRAFTTETAATQADRFAAFLDALLAAPDSPLGDPELLTARELERLVAFNATAAPFPATATVHALFADQVRATPERPALLFAGEELTFTELSERAGRLARRLAARGAGPGCLVALCAERSMDMVVGILAALKAGAAYLPFDSAYPRERIAYMLEDSGAELVLVQRKLLALLPAERAVSERTLLLEESAGEADAPPGVLLREATADDLAYVLYTSGSTGKPKGVMVPHRGVVNYLHWAIETYGAAQGAAPVHSPIGFDLTVTSLFAPLLAGSPVELLPEERGIEALGETLRAGRGYALAKLTPAHLTILGPIAAQGEPANWAKTLVLGGETLLGESLAHWRDRAPEVRIVNEYGPTETVVGCAVYTERAGAIAPGPVPIGRPIANARLHLLETRGRPVPEGVPGEIYIGGAGVARGYLGRPDLTAERFVPDPFSTEPGTRLYRSGDLARLLPSGDLEFLGRNDRQVKIRGVRLELGEIEAALASFPGISEAAVLAREDRPGEQRLVAYYTVEREPPPNVDELRRHLASSLPEAMLPAMFLRLAALPLTPNGKVDRAALPAPGNARPDLEREYVAPRNEIETALAEIWSEVLGLERIGVDDSFFALGGDSIRSVRVIALAKERGLELTVELLFRRPTVAALAADLETATVSEGESEEEELSLLLADLDKLSDEEVQSRLRDGQAEP
jgi:amino acid adenylation domain-containing protein